MQIKVKRLHEDAKLPTRNHDGDAGWDIYCLADDEFRYSSELGNYFVMEPGECKVFETGISWSIPKGYVGLLWDRSGMGAKRNIHRLAGVVDSGYLGQILVCLVNLSNEQQVIKQHDRIIQVIFHEIPETEVIEVEDLDDTSRGDLGFGSSGD